MTRRREGFIEKRNGRFYAGIEGRLDPVTHKRRRQAVGGFKTKAEAAEAIHDEIERRRRRAGGSRKLTFAAFLVDWMIGVDLALEPTSAAVYRVHVDSYIVPGIGAEPIRELTPATLTRFYADLKKGGGRKGRALAPRTVRNVHRTVRTALESAHEERLIDWNPAASRSTRVPPVPRTERPTWTPDELQRFLAFAASDRLAALYVVAATTAMRRGELCGLRWRDVDLDAGRIQVRTTLVQYGTAVHEKGPKTTASIRDIPSVDPRAIAALRAHKVRQTADRLAAGSAWNVTGRVFTDELGQDLRPGSVTKSMTRLVRRAGLPHLTPHGLRHTFATVALEAGVDVVYVSELLGHTYSTTTALYQHARPDRTADAGRKIANALLGDG